MLILSLGKIHWEIGIHIENHAEPIYLLLFFCPCKLIRVTIDKFIIFIFFCRCKLVRVTIDKFIIFIMFLTLHKVSK